MTIDIMMQSSTLFPDLDTPNVGGSLCEDERALQIALELSNLGLLGNCDDDPSAYDDINKGKKSQNMTECVPVPSSEHVAEIVGRQGCKIKALRAKTNTYIKTPVRGEEPVFVVTGRKEDVAMARREVQSAAEHFTQIRATRNRHALLASQAFNTGNGEGTSGAITLQVRVPYRVVGLVVGPKGATIKRIQQQTHTYIVTPSRDKEPVFEVTGLPENVEKAKEEIEAHIALRTGSQQTSIDDDFRNNGTDVGSPCLDFGFKPSINAQSTASLMPHTSIRNSVLRSAAPNFFPMSTQHGFKQVNSTSRTAMIVSSMDMLGLTDRSYKPNLQCSLPQNESQTPWSLGMNNNPYDSTIPALLPNINNGSITSTSINPTNFNHSRLSPTLSELDFPAFSPLLLPNNTPAPSHHPVCRVGSEESTTSGNAPSSYAPTAAINIESGYSSGTTESMSGSPDSALGLSRDTYPTKSHHCILCNNTLDKCGQHLFSYSCTNENASNSAVCSCCQSATNALHTN